MKVLAGIGMLLTIVGGLLSTSCTNDRQEPLFVMRSAEETGIDFANVITENDSINLLDYEYVYNGGGVAVADINADGLPDLFFSGNMVPSRLYLNEGGFKFRDITRSAGIADNHWATGVAVADVNNDGWPDLYVCSAGNVPEPDRANHLYINNGDNTFTERARAYGVDDTGFSTMAAFLDYNRDGHMDLYVLTYANDTWDTSIIYPKVTDGTGKATDRLYRNNGDGTFTNVSMEAGIRFEGYGLGVAVCDLNTDGWPDLYVSNDYLDDDFLYLNNGDGTFTESAAKYLKHISHFAMGNDVADYNNDGQADIIVVDMEPEDYTRKKLFSMTKNYEKFAMSLRMGYLPAYMRNTLQLNNGDGTFSEVGQLAGVHYTDWSWAPLLADLDNDGYKDLFVSNGYPKDIMNRDFLVYNKYAGSFQSVRNPPSLQEQHRFRLQAITELHGTRVINYLFRNNGDLTFTKVSEEWGFNIPSYSNGAAYADLDGDGDLDLVVNNINDPAFVYENRAEALLENHYLRIRLDGDSANRFALGATVWLYAGGGGVQVQENYPYRGFQSSVDPVLHFGLGQTENVDSLIVRWPDDRVTVRKNIAANQLLTLRQSDATPRPSAPSPPAHTRRFHDVTEDSGIRYVHREPDHNDFKIQPLLPHKLSQAGPGIAVGDVNGDDLTDFYVGGSQQFSGGLYFQQRDGTFTQQTFTPEHAGDDLGSLFFDADGDGDLDLYIVSGGNELMAGIDYYQDHLYFNDGSGNLVLNAKAIPNMNASGSGVAAADWDRDGDLDLFVAGRTHPGNYPFPGTSFLLRNDGGTFTDVTDEVAGHGLSRMGMITCAVWTDFNNDLQADLILAGEWMPVTLLKNEGGRFVNVTQALGLADHTGWWNSIVSGDFDNDNDIDYIVGNLGMNTPYKPTADQPLSIYAKDFDQNGKPEALLTYYIQGKEQTVHSRDEITDQINFVKKRFPRYQDFATADFSQLLTPEERKGSYRLHTKISRSVYLENKGEDGFALHPLPIEAQFAPLFGMAAVDVDGDGNLDVIGVGNSHATEIAIGRYDALFGVYLKGDGKGNFKTVPNKESGLLISGDAKGIATLVDAHDNLLALVTKNCGPLQALSLGPVRQVLRLHPQDAWAEVVLPNGARRRQDLPYGGTYISQSDRTLIIPENAVSVRIFSFSGEERSVTLTSSP